MKKIYFSFCLFSVIGVNAQDVHFSQVTNNPLHINPANVGGFRGYERVVLNYRSQWFSSGAPYNTMGFSYDMPMLQRDGTKAHLGLGFSVYSDKAGDSKFGTTAPALSIGGIVPLGKGSYLTSAIQAGYTMYSINFAAVQWQSQFNGQQYDPSLPTLENSANVSTGVFDLGAGVRYALDAKKETFGGFIINKFDIGLGVYHITQPKLNFLTNTNALYRKFVAHTSARIDLKDANIGFMPFFVYYKQGPHSEINAGLMARWKFKDGTKITGFKTEAAFSFGFSVRANDAIIPQFMFEYGSWGLGVSYDLTTSNYKEVNKLNGGFEISLKWQDLKGVVFKKRVKTDIY